MKFILLVMDGAGDTGEATPLQTARKPNMDSLAASGKNGLLDIGYSREVDSDVGYLTILSCFSKGEYPGRGYIEALGAGLDPGPGDLCIRGNFATLDSRGNVTDRRAGRDETGLDELSSKLDGMEIDGAHFRVVRTTGHRVVIVASGPGLSDRIIPNDPMKTDVPLGQIAARAPAGKRTASALNKFLYRANAMLTKDPVNRKRSTPANAIIVRSIGMRKDVEPFRERFGLRACCVAGVNVAKGVARFLGIDVIDVKGATGRPDTDIGAKMKACLRSLKDHDVVFLHINGTDILAHDKDRAGKARFIERIDKELGNLLRQLDMKETCIVLTCDHRTASLAGYKGYEHLRDPVPICISGGGVRPDGVERFDEASAEKGSLRLRGTELIPLLRMLTGKRQA
jgi:2,3-bisphosphoglycerate-independent phosphoglycerate mutase